MTNSTKADKQKDSPQRSIFKAFSWRFIASGATFIISFVIFHQYTTKSSAEIFETASIITIVDVIAKLILYYLHERLWTNVTWGKYWKKRAWKRKYRKMHKGKGDD